MAGAGTSRCSQTLIASALQLSVQEVRGLKLSKDQLRETYFDGTILNFRSVPKSTRASRRIV